MLVIFIGLSIIQCLATIVLFYLHRLARAEAMHAQRRVEELTKQLKDELERKQQKQVDLDDMLAAREAVVADLRFASAYLPEHMKVRLYHWWIETRIKAGEVSDRLGANLLSSYLVMLDASLVDKHIDTSKWTSIVDSIVEMEYTLCAPQNRAASEILGEQKRLTLELAERPE